MRFPRDPAVIRKFIIALIGFVLMVAAQFGLVVPDVVSEQLGALIDSAISLAVAIGVFAVPNKPDNS